MEEGEYVMVMEILDAGDDDSSGNREKEFLGRY